MNRLVALAPARYSRRSAKAVLVDRERSSIQSSWRDLLELRRDARARFSVYVRKFSDGKWELGNTCKGLVTPLQVMNAIGESADLLGTEIEYVKALPLIASLDWVTAAVIAEKMGCGIPTLPEFPSLIKQRSLRSFGRVIVGVEWGHDMHEIFLPFDRWLQVLGGDRYIKSAPYHYEGESFRAQWRFNDLQLEVIYDGEGVGWDGDLHSLGLLKGPQVDGVDIAKLALLASSS
jgi:hypothetical protein